MKDTHAQNYYNWTIVQSIVHSYELLNVINSAERADQREEIPPPLPTRVVVDSDKRGHSSRQ